MSAAHKNRLQKRKKSNLSLDLSCLWSDQETDPLVCGFTL